MIAASLTDVSADHASTGPVHHLTLRIRAGDITAIRGDTRSGAGTVIGILSGRLPPASGTVQVGGRRRDSTDSRNPFRRSVVCVTGNQRLIPWLTAGETTDLAGRLHDVQSVDLPTPWQIPADMTLVDRLDLELEIACMRRPDVLVLDPDQAPGSNWMANALHRLRRQGFTVLARAPSSVADSDVIDREVLIMDGRTVSDSAHYVDLSSAGERGDPPREA